MLLGAYVYTGEDCLSAFKDKGKFAPLKKLIKYPKIYSALSTFGEEGIVPEDVTKELEELVYVMYGYVSQKLLNAVKTKMLKKMVGEDEVLATRSKVDLSRFPPCRYALFTHI